MERTFWQKLEGTTEQVLAQLRKLIEEGNIRRVVVKQKGKTIAEFPLTAGVIGAVIAPVAAAIGALTALITECSIPPETAIFVRSETHRRRRRCVCFLGVSE